MPTVGWTGAWSALTRPRAGPTSTRPGPHGEHHGPRKRINASAAPPRRRTRTLQGRPDLQNPPRRRRRTPTAGPADHARTVGRQSEADPRARTDPGHAARGGHTRTRPDHLGGDKSTAPAGNRRYLCRRQIKHTIPEPKDQRANRRRRGSRGGRPAGFDKEMHRRRNEVERTINQLQALQGRGDPIRQARLRLHGHRHQGLDSTVAQALTGWLRQRASRSSARCVSSAAMPSQSGPCSHRFCADSRRRAGSSGLCSSTRR